MSAPVYNLFNYYPTKSKVKTSKEDDKVRRLVWKFKANNESESESELKDRHKSAFNYLVPKVSKLIDKNVEFDRLKHLS